MLPLADGFTLILTDLFDVSKTYSWEEFLKFEVIFLFLIFRDRSLPESVCPGRVYPPRFMRGGSP